MEQGEFLRQRYRIIETLRPTAASMTYLAMDERSREIIAVKVFKGIGRYGGFQHRFRDLAQRLARVDVPHMVPMFDFGFEDDRSYLVTQYVAGRTLAEILNERGRLPVDEALGIALQLAKALGAIRRNVILHGMLNPLSVLQNNQSLCLLDYDLVVTVLAAEGAEAVSREAVRYQSPEQIEEGKKLSSQSDIYSLGVMLFEMISGRVPYDGDNSGQIVRKHLETYVPSLSLYVPDVPEAVSELVAGCLSKSPSKRPKGFAEFAMLVSGVMSSSEPRLRADREAQRRSSEQSKGQSDASWATLTSASGKVYSLPADRKLIRIGRRDVQHSISPDVDLGEEDTRRHVSRRHAQILVDGEYGFLVEEAGVRSHITINGREMKPNERVLLRDNDRIEIAEIRLTFRTHSQG